GHELIPVRPDLGLGVAARDVRARAEALRDHGRERRELARGLLELRLVERRVAVGHRAQLDDLPFDRMHDALAVTHGVRFRRIAEIGAAATARNENQRRDEGTEQQGKTLHDCDLRCWLWKSAEHIKEPVLSSTLRRPRKDRSKAHASVSTRSDYRRAASSRRAVRARAQSRLARRAR